MNRITGESHSNNLNTKGCLLRQVNSVSSSDVPSFGGRHFSTELHPPKVYLF